MEAAEGTKSSYEKPNPRKSWTGGSKWISKLSQSFEAVQYKAIKNTMHHLLKNNRLHHIAISLQSSKGLEPVSSTYNRTTNKLQMFAMLDQYLAKLDFNPTKESNETIKILYFNIQ